MSPSRSHKETTALCRLYREAILELLDVIAVSAVIQDFGMREAVTNAKALLYADSTAALALQRIHQIRETHCYELAMWAHHQIYHCPRRQGSAVPAEDEIRDILRDIDLITEEEHLLRDQLHATAEQGGV